jgi:hypothetical protein
VLAYQQGDYAAARALDEESLAIQRQSGDRKGIAASLNNPGLVARDQGIIRLPGRYTREPGDQTGTGRSGGDRELAEQPRECRFRPG